MRERRGMGAVRRGEHVRILAAVYNAITSAEASASWGRFVCSGCRRVYRTPLTQEALAELPDGVCVPRAGASLVA